MSTRSNQENKEPHDEHSLMEGEIEEVSMKIPSFWKHNPEVWFAQMEAQFRTRGITRQETKFDYVVGTIDREIVSEVMDIIRNPPEVDPYNRLKAAIIDRITDFERRRTQQQLSQEELGDKKPSQFLRRLLHLLEDGAKTFDQELLKKLFLQKMPPSIKSFLEKQESPLEEIANLADMILDTYETRPAIVSAITNLEMALINKRLDNLEEQIECLMRWRESRSSRRRGASQSGLCFCCARFQGRAYNGSFPYTLSARNHHEQTRSHSTIPKRPAFS
ncbi:uncharacterized protein LOC122529568 [Frieseomelitta varia]|uniref:uncharacterized protein LOC122529568 n=1 Tax=Frieseomelitta varia TaxID=561572 RepID=UPI001CB68329|nr:uncharacterized protein LOC122529568 [Frieseomelitta varia]